MALVGPLTSLGLAVFLGVLRGGCTAWALFQLQFALFTWRCSTGAGGVQPAAGVPHGWGAHRARGADAEAGGGAGDAGGGGAGRVFAVLFGVWGVVSFNPFTLVIAFFVLMGAEAESRQVRMRVALEHVKVEALMTPRLVGVDLDLSMADAQWALRREHVRLLPVTNAGRRWGACRGRRCRRVPEEERAGLHGARRDGGRRGGGAGEDGWTALRRMAEARVPLVAVVDEEGLLAGTLDWNDFQRGMIARGAGGGARRDSRTGWPRERPA